MRQAATRTAGRRNGRPRLGCPTVSLHLRVDRAAAARRGRQRRPGRRWRPHRAVVALPCRCSPFPLGVAAFFRDPDRTPDHRQVDRDLVLAPADGKVMYVGPGQVGVAPPGAWQQVSIFLSLFDVHINRTPYGGRVEEVTYRPGQVARRLPLRERDRERAQRDHPGRHGRRRGAPGRVPPDRRAWSPAGWSPESRPGDVLRTGQRIGLMKFGSRMDVFVPPHVELVAVAGDRTVAGETVIARWPALTGSSAEPGHREVQPPAARPVAAAVALGRRGRLAAPAQPRERLRVTAPSMFTTGNMACGFSAILLAFATSSPGRRRCWPGRSCSTSPTVPSPGSSGRPRRSASSSTRWPTWSPSAWRRRCSCTPGRCRRTRSLAWLSAFFWLACAAFRLARFNVTVDPLADKKYFVGLPSPGATLVVIATILALRHPGARARACSSRSASASSPRC